MLDDVERRAFLVQPTRKHSIPFAVGLQIVELDEGAGQALGFPRRGRIAGAQAHHDVFHPNRLSRLERKIANDSVALVEQGNHRHPLGHRGDARRLDPRRQRFRGDLIVGQRLVGSGRVATGEGKRNHGSSEDARHAHAWSGVQAL